MRFYPLLKKPLISKKKCLSLFFFISIFLFCVFYLYFFRNITDDELYNYGYAHNILNHLVPYRDFNMIVPPLFAYLCALFQFVLGDKLIVYHIVISLLITSIFFLAYSKLGYPSIVILVFSLFYPFAGYNVLSLFLLFLLLSVRGKKHGETLSSVIIILLILTKQTFALFMIPNLLETKNLKRTILIYLVGIFCSLLYFVCFDNLFSFINYCFLGMFDFTSSNYYSGGVLFWIECFFLFYLFVYYLCYRDIQALYIALFQIVVFPIVDFFHFCIGVIPVIYFLFKKFRFNPFLHHLLFVFFFTIACTLHFVMISKIQYENLGHYSTKNFMYLRLVSNNTASNVQKIREEIETNSSLTVFFLGTDAYFMKLNLDIPIHQFDNINNGNMGYHGVEKYISKIKNICQVKKCMFVFDDKEATGARTTQTNKIILNYVKDNYFQYYSSASFDLYKNF